MASQDTSPHNLAPEAQARQDIDKKLLAAGYVLQDMHNFNPTASLGVVVREFATKSGPVDYLIFIDGKPVGVIEAKAENKGESLSSVAEQSKRYAESGLRHTSAPVHIRFAYEATNIITHFCDYNDEKARSREVFSFHTPQRLKAWLLEWNKEESTLRNRLKAFPAFDDTGFRHCQTQAIENLEKSFGQNYPRALVQMATGAGKTFTAITSVYRLLKFAKAKRILFLVDTKNLGEQAEEEFRSYKPNDDARLFTELYNVHRLNSPHIPESSHVCISTIQRMYSILCNEELDESLEETSLNEVQLTQKQKEVVYNKKYPIDFFDFIIIDECHRSIYNVWQQVLDYFDAFYIGLTATPDKRTFAFFQENVVSEYPHEQAVIDGVNVGREGTYLIETAISQKGGVILKQHIEKRNRLSRQRRWEQMDEDLSYTPSQLDKDVINPSQIRHIIRAFRDAVKIELFPLRQELPKTLIFAKTDSHADDIIKIVREEFGEGNEFCKKITYNCQDDPKSLLASFRNGYYPRIAVTVDMIATGTDVKAIECLLFMRDVRSKNYYEQMLGRATRTLDRESLQKVSPSATSAKLGYILVDAVGVSTSQKSTSRQLERMPTVSLKNLLMDVVMGNHDEDTLTSLSRRLIKLHTEMSEKEKTQCHDLAQGKSLPSIAQDLLNAFDEDVIQQKAVELFPVPTLETETPSTVHTEEQLNEAQIQLIKEAVHPLNAPELRNFIIDARKKHDQIIDTVNMDSIAFAGWESDQATHAEKTIQSFQEFIAAHKDSLTALQIIYAQSYKNRPLLYKNIEELHTALQKAGLSSAMLWKAYEIMQPQKVKKRVEDKLADIISLVRFELGQAAELEPFSARVSRNFRDWTLKKNAGHLQFTEEQMHWLRMIRDHIATSAHIDSEDLEYTPFDGAGGLGKFYELFGAEYEVVLHEMNMALVA